MTSPSNALARRDQDIAWLRGQLAPAREPLARLTGSLPSVEPISSEGDAREQAERIQQSDQALADIEACVAPVRSRIHALRTELSRRVRLATDAPKECLAQAKRVLGAWRARERVRQQAAAANARMAAAHADTAAQAAAGLRAAPEPSGPKGTRRAWKVEVRDEPALRASMLRLVMAAAPEPTTAPVERVRVDNIRRVVVDATGDGPAAARALVDALYVSEPRLRAALANADGAHAAELAGLQGIRVYSEDVAI